MWLPDIKSLERPVYMGLAKDLKRAIEDNTLHQGERLPTHREMSDRLGVTVGTVTKAFNIVEKEGLIVSKVGRGTYVGQFPEEVLADHSEPKEVIDLRFNSSLVQPFNSALNSILGSISRRKSLHGLFEHHPGTGAEQHRSAGSTWMKMRGVEIAAENIIVSDNMWAAMISVLASFRECGETILTENINIIGLQHLADLYQLKLTGIQADEQGLLPEELLKAGSEKQVGAIFCSPSMHDPTNTTMDYQRRKEIIEVARKLNCHIIENDSSGHLADDNLPTIASLAPDISVYICGTSKSLAPGLRVGFIGQQKELLIQLQNAMHAMPWTSSTLTGEVASAIINNERTCNRLLNWHRKDALERQRMAARILDCAAQTPPYPSYHVWLPLPSHWQAEAFCAQLEQKDVLVYPAQEFAINGENVPNAIRICLGGVSDPTRLSNALSTIAELLAGESTLGTAD